jgi:ferritin
MLLTKYENWRSKNAKITRQQASGTQRSGPRPKPAGDGDTDRRLSKMLNSSIQDAINSQINAEIYSSYLYLSMSAYFESKNLGGMANWMRLQAQEELLHAMKFFDYVNERGGRVVLTEIESPRTDWDSPVDAFQHTCDHESEVTARINKLVDLAIADKDHAANTFLQWFVTEQVEEEATAQTILEKLKMVGDHGVAILMLDEELGQRSLAPPSAE